MSTHFPGGLVALGWTPRLDAALVALERPDLIPARVAAVHRGRLDLATADGPLAGTPTGRLAHAATNAVDLPAVGDWVAADPATGSVHALLPRRGGIARAAGDGRAEPQVLAANVDVALVVGSLNLDFNLRRIERFLTLAADAEAEALVVLSKADLSEDPAATVLDVRAALGGTVPVLAVSVVDGSGMEALGAWLRPGRTAVLLGSSGVGKTTLLNHLTGEERPTLPVREGDDRGRHTTSHRELVPLASGALVIDTPGPAPAAHLGAGGGAAERVRRHRGARGAVPLRRLLASRRARMRRRGRDRRRAPGPRPAHRPREARARGGTARRPPRRAPAIRAPAPDEADPQGAAAHVPRARQALSACRGGCCVSTSECEVETHEPAVTRSSHLHRANICSQMTSSGSPYARFQRALVTGNLTLIRTAAAELPRIGVAEAAAMLLVIQRADPGQYERAAIRWLGRLCLEQRTRVDLEDLSRAATALDALPDRPEDARRLLAEVCDRAGQAQAAAVFGA